MIKIIAVFLLFVNIYANDALDNYIKADNSKITILCFYTTWCPACQQSIDLLHDLQTQLQDKIRIIGINLDDSTERNFFIDDTKIKFKVIKLNIQDTKEYGVKDSIPVILVLNEKHLVIKRFYETPNRDYFLKLIKRVSSGYLENGTLPIENRVDLWKNKRN